MISITSLYWIWNFMNILWLNDIQCLNSCYIFIFFSSCGIEPTHSIPLSVCWTIELRPFSSLAWSSQLLAFPVPIPSSFGSIGGNIKPHVFGLFTSRWWGCKVKSNHRPKSDNRENIEKGFQLFYFNKKKSIWKNFLSRFSPVLSMARIVHYIQQSHWLIGIYSIMLFIWRGDFQTRSRTRKLSQEGSTTSCSHDD